MIRYRNIVLVILLTIAVALLMVGSYYDLEISQAFADPGCGWARVIEAAAEPPTILLCSLMCGIIFLRMKKERETSSSDKAPPVIFMLFMIIAEIGTVSYAVIRTLIYLDLSLLIAIPIIPIICALIFASAKPIEKRLTPEMIRTTISCIISAVIVLITINIIKSLWGRVRYRDMYISGEMFSQFTDWFKPNGFNIAGGQDSSKSFPSGHTSNAVLLFYLTYYAKYLTKNKTKIMVISVIVISLWSIITAVSRVAIGAHYLSDVTAGAAITGAIVYFVGLLRREYK